MNVITVMLLEEPFGTLVAAATTVRDQAKACANSLGLSPALGLQYRERAAALGNAVMALEMNARPGNVSAKLADLKERHTDLLRQLDEEKARGAALSAALLNALERLGSAAGPVGRRGGKCAVFEHLTRSARLACTPRRTQSSPTGKTRNPRSTPHACSDLHPHRSRT